MDKFTLSMMSKTLVYGVIKNDGCYIMVYGKSGEGRFYTHNAENNNQVNTKSGGKGMPISSVAA